MSASLAAVMVLALAAQEPAAAPAVAPVPATAGAAADKGAAAATPAEATPNALEKALLNLPRFAWDPEQPLQRRISHLGNFFILGGGLASVLLGFAGVGFTAILQLAPVEDSDPRERPRATFIKASQVVTAGFFVVGTVAVLGALFTLVAG